MSTITATMGPSVRVGSRSSLGSNVSGSNTRLRLTARGRRVLALLAALPAVIALSLAIIAGGSAIAAKDSGTATQSFDTVTVTSGDTLWTIAEEVAPQADPRDVVSAIVRLNLLEDVTISAGQRIAIPAEYSARAADAAP